MQAQPFLGIVGLFLLSASAAAQPKPGALPLKRVRLYETGVAYFERSGAVTSSARLPVPEGHLDDALKTLVVLSANGKTKVQGVHFASRVSGDLSRAVAGLKSGEAGATTMETLMSSLVGASVQINVRGASWKGRLMSVLPKATTDLTRCVLDAKKKQQCQKIPSAVFLADTGELRRIPLQDVGFVRPLDKTRLERLRAASGALGGATNAGNKSIEVVATQGGPITLGYIAETPVWRSTYRLVVGSKRAVLQGWALVHNDTDEPWKQVKLELVNGRPDSFLFPLAAPRYTRRELVTPEETLSTVPQLLGDTVDGAWGALLGDEIGESFGAGGLGLSGVGSGGGGRGEGIGLGSVGTIGHGAGSGHGESSILDVGNLAAVATQEGVEAGAQFTYTLAGAIDLKARNSALLPFVQRDVTARRIALFSEAGTSARSAVRFQNETGQTLPAGPLAVFSNGGLAGEAAIDRLKPKEVQFVSFGLDMDISVDLDSAAKPVSETRYVSMSGKVLREHFVRRRVERYRLENRSGAPRTVYLRLSTVKNARVTGADRMDFDPREQRAHAVFEVPPRSKGTRTLKLAEGLTGSLPLASLNSRLLRKLTRSKALPKSQRETLLRAASALHQAEIRTGARGKRRVELNTYRKDSHRLRGHARALGGKHGAEAARRLLDLEDKIRRTRRRIATLSAEIKEMRQRAEVALRQLPKR